jgi:hypothetical protein
VPGLRPARLRAYFGDPRLGSGAIAAVLRGSFLALFAAQGLVAALVALAAVLVAGPQRTPSAWVGGVAVVASAGQLLLGLAITAAGVRNAGRAARGLGSERPAPSDPQVPPDGRDADAERRLRTARSAALSLALLAAVLLSTPAWFAAFAWATGQTPVVLGLIGVLLATGYAFGVGQLGPLARAVTVTDPLDPPDPPDPGGDGSDAG